MTATRTNWAGNIVFHARQLHRPTSVAEVQQLVASTDTLRALGTGHSFSPLADTTGDQISVGALPPTIEIDTAATQVSVAAGIRFGELTPVLFKAGWALHNLGSLPHISLAGACATGTHGSGSSNGNLASAVSALEMVTDDGELVRLQRGDADFDGCVVALGALGIVTRLTLHVVPAFDIQQYVYDDLSWANLVANLDEILSSAYSVSIFTDWTGGASSVWVKRLASLSIAQPTSWLGAQLAREPRHPIKGMPAEHATQQLGQPGPSHERLPHFRLAFTPSSGAELQSEYLLLASEAPAALTALAEIGDRIAAVLQVGEIRTVAADGLWLSPSYEQDSVAIHFTWVPDLAAVLAVLFEVEQRLAPFRARPHWGKVHQLRPADLAALYPRFSDFSALLAKYDSGSKFSNAEIERYFH